ncbi:uncharacterized protein LOC123499169 isoform X2 [Portunus trituberculatus]|uniref:uncharacterized protein LOC123499169 isoform X2 n=1 Tax=Portunus trituberculatus TaxID=210409 RepID=UPI001E1D0F5F|nr:uncharacterized protein LOC123499169 isoform X2 [Portunus trituberculatus]
MKVSLPLLAVLIASIQSAPAPQSVILPNLPLFEQTDPTQNLPQTAPTETQVWPVLPYSYSYTVSDLDTNNFQNKAEIMNELGDVFGSYSVLMPDNIIYTTTYNVTGNSGFVARVEKSLPQLAPPANGPANGSANGPLPNVASPSGFFV